MAPPDGLGSGAPTPLGPAARSSRGMTRVLVSQHQTVRVEPPGFAAVTTFWYTSELLLMLNLQPADGRGKRYQVRQLQAAGASTD
jgi:hypothetical protein